MPLCDEHDDPALWTSLSSRSTIPSHSLRWNARLKGEELNSITQHVVNAKEAGRPNIRTCGALISTIYYRFFGVHTSEASAPVTYASSTTRSLRSASCFLSQCLEREYPSHLSTPSHLHNRSPPPLRRSPISFWRLLIVRRLSSSFGALILISRHPIIAYRECVRCSPSVRP